MWVQLGKEEFSNRVYAKYWELLDRYFGKLCVNGQSLVTVESNYEGMNEVEANAAEDEYLFHCQLQSLGPPERVGDVLRYKELDVQFLFERIRVVLARIDASEELKEDMEGLMQQYMGLLAFKRQKIKNFEKRFIKMAEPAQNVDNKRFFENLVDVEPLLIDVTNGSNKSTITELPHKVSTITSSYHSKIQSTITHFEQFVRDRCKSGNLGIEEAKGLFDNSLFDSYDSKDFEFLVRDRCKSRNLGIEEAKCLFDHAIQMRPLPSILLFTQLLGVLCKLRQYSTVFTLFKMMESEGIRPDLFTLSTLINCFCQMGKVDFGLAVVGNPLLKIFPTTANPLLKMFPTTANPKSTLPIRQKKLIKMLNVTKSGLIPLESIALNIVITVGYCLNLHMAPSS
ncbi:hypothetical protein GIB67_036052 [Kingdonia uniflora]|uniref:Pentatricopeptide repeat-containing protein n=1 Tax=Kingdonia uniflora TaxID=39325 RepID=A0A7J7N0X9_9MAGN|nr:hypothetical protein GIB67_036052 [Kingdonia uniflora]